MILDSIIENLEAEGLLQSVPRTHVVLGYSGGADSTALLYLLHEIKQKRPLDVTAAYFNHRWRGTPPAELPLIHQHCQATATPLVIIQADLTIPKTESAARIARYKQLTGLARDLHADAVLTAHHADDQIETLLFRIFRGTGIDGLIGIQKRLVLEGAAGAPVPVLRPMLDIARKKIRDYTSEKQLEYYRDPTNEELKFQRSNIRNQILPFLEQNFPQVKNSLFRLSLVAEGDLHIIDETINNVWQEVYGEDKTGPFLRAIRFNQLGMPYQRRVLKRFLGRQNIHTDFQTIEEVMAFIQGEGRKKLDSSLKSMVKGDDGKTRFLSLYKDQLRLIEEPDIKPAPPEALPVSLPGENMIAARNLTFKALAWQAPDKVLMRPIRPNDNRQVFVNLSSFADKPLELRTRRPGDKFQPMGMPAPLRFKKFLINRGVPRFDRDKLLVLASGNQILWAPGLGISQQLRIAEKALPTHLLKLEKADQPLIEPTWIEIEPPERELPPELSKDGDDDASPADSVEDDTDSPDDANDTDTLNTEPVAEHEDASPGALADDLAQAFRPEFDDDDDEDSQEID